MDYDDAFFGIPDALVNWCEQDYVYFNFIAEFWNTISNFLTIVWGIVLYLHYKKYKCERRFTNACLLMILVGIGSSAFHGTLRYYFQLLDELPMLYLTCSLSYIVIEMPHKIRRYPYLPIICVVSCSVLTVGHLILKNAELFFAAFGILLAPAIVYPITHITVKPYITTMKYSFLIVNIAFACWEIDRFFCHYTHDLYLHAWWHVGTCMSGVLWMNGMVFLRKRYVLKEPCRLLYYGLWVELDSK